MQVEFEGWIKLTQHCIENKRLDALFSKYNIRREVDEHNYEGKNFEYEQSRQLMIESYGITFIRANPDAADLDMDRLINQIYTHIIKSTKKQTKVSTRKLLIDDFSKTFLELKFKSNHPKKSKCLKWMVKNILPNSKTWKMRNQK